MELWDELGAHFYCPSLAGYENWQQLGAQRREPGRFLDTAFSDDERCGPEGIAMSEAERAQNRVFHNRVFSE